MRGQAQWRISKMGRPMQNQVPHEELWKLLLLTTVLYFAT